MRTDRARRRTTTRWSRCPTSGTAETTRMSQISPPSHPHFESPGISPPSHPHFESPGDSQRISRGRAEPPDAGRRAPRVSARRARLRAGAATPRLSRARPPRAMGTGTGTLRVSVSNAPAGCGRAAANAEPVRHRVQIAHQMRSPWRRHARRPRPPRRRSFAARHAAEKRAAETRFLRADARSSARAYQPESACLLSAGRLIKRPRGHQVRFSFPESKQVDRFRPPLHPRPCGGWSP